MRGLKSLALAPALALLLGASTAAAVPCGSPDLLDVVPPDGATAVPLNAQLSAFYATIAEYIDEEVTLDHGDQTSIAQATFNASEGILGVTPPAPFVAGDDYVIHWPRLRGVGTATLGRARDVHFTAGAAEDAAAPSFEGLTSLEWDVDRDNDECTGDLQDRTVFDLGLSPAADDGGRESLTLVVFQTAGPDIRPEDGPVPVKVMRLPEQDGAKVRISRGVDTATGHVCFAALVRDLTGKSSNGADHQVCADTVAPPFFYGCAVARATPPSPAWAALGLLALGVAGSARRRARPAS